MPRLSGWVDDCHGHHYRSKILVPAQDERLALQARRYLENLALMHEHLAARGAGFLSVFQPAAQLHARLDRTVPMYQMPTIDAMHRRVAEAPKSFAWLDLARVFDEEIPQVSVMRDRLDDELIFLDEVHVTDRGNAIVARHIAEAVAAYDAAGWPGVRAAGRN